MAILNTSYSNHSATITINNHPANTWTPELLIELKKQILIIETKSEITCLILASALEKFFSAGADLKRFDNKTVAQVISFVEAFAEAFEALSQFSGLSIAAINGYAMGGGLEVALACDLRIAETQAILALPEASVGLLPCAGGTQNLTRLVGEPMAKRMILCGKKLSAQEALNVGLVDEMVDKGEAKNTANSYALATTKQSPEALRSCKKLIQMNRHQFTSDALKDERSLFLELFKGSNYKEGISAFLEKRQPSWNYGNNKNSP